jgi:1,4-alpha-glucan branching enzyme
LPSLGGVPNKSYTKNQRTCRVTFELPAVIEATAANVVGDFNGWSDAAIPMKKRKDGRLSVTVSLEAGRAYRYRFLLDGERWENDWAADAYVPNDFGSEDSLVKV